MAGRYTGSYLDRSNGWRAVATLADIGRASLVGRIPRNQLGLCQDDDNKTAFAPIADEIAPTYRNIVSSFNRIRLS